MTHERVTNRAKHRSVFLFLRLLSTWKLFLEFRPKFSELRGRCLFRFGPDHLGTCHGYDECALFFC